MVGRPDGTRPNPIEAQFKWLAETVYPTGNMNQDCLKAQAPGEGWRASTTPSLALGCAALTGHIPSVHHLFGCG